MAESLTRASKFLTLVLRHDPQALGLKLDPCGWAEVSEIVRQSEGREPAFSRELLEQIVACCTKQRFQFNADRTKIRCQQGHSIKVELGLEPRQPPAQLYHGTATRFLESILAEGLRKQERHHVHLSANVDTAATVGARYGNVVILQIQAGQMFAAGHQFYLSGNGVWLTDHVPPGYLKPL